MFRRSDLRGSRSRVNKDVPQKDFFDTPHLNLGTSTQQTKNNVVKERYRRYGFKGREREGSMERAWNFKEGNGEDR